MCCWRWLGGALLLVACNERFIAADQLPEEVEWIAMARIDGVVVEASPMVRLPAGNVLRDEGGTLLVLGYSEAQVVALGAEPDVTPLGPRGACDAVLPDPIFARAIDGTELRVYEEPLPLLGAPWLDRCPAADLALEVRCRSGCSPRLDVDGCQVRATLAGCGDVVLEARAGGTLCLEGAGCSEIAASEQELRASCEIEGQCEVSWHRRIAAPPFSIQEVAVVDAPPGPAVDSVPQVWFTRVGHLRDLVVLEDGPAVSSFDRYMPSPYCDPEVSLTLHFFDERLVRTSTAALAPCTAISAAPEGDRVWAAWVERDRIFATEVAGAATSAALPGIAGAIFWTGATASIAGHLLVIVEYSDRADLFGSLLYAWRPDAAPRLLQDFRGDIVTGMTANGDGRALLFDDNGDNIYLVDVSDGRMETRAPLFTSFRGQAPHLDPDTGVLYVASIDESPGLYRLPPEALEYHLVDFYPEVAGLTGIAPWVEEGVLFVGAHSRSTDDPGRAWIGLFDVVDGRFLPAAFEVGAGAVRLESRDDAVFAILPQAGRLLRLSR